MQNVSATINAARAVLVRYAYFVTITGQVVCINPGTIVTVDPVERIAVYQGEHFSVEPDDFCLIH
jgi:hypothetical protein